MVAVTVYPQKKRVTQMKIILPFSFISFVRKGNFGAFSPSRFYIYGHSSFFYGSTFTVHLEFLSIGLHTHNWCVGMMFRVHTLSHTYKPPSRACTNTHTHTHQNQNKTRAIPFMLSPFVSSTLTTIPIIPFVSLCSLCIVPLEYSRG